MLKKNETEENNYGHAEEFYGNDVVIKILTPGMFSGSEALARFKREIDTQVEAGIESPYVVPVNDVIEVRDEDGNETLGLVIQYMKDGDLADFMEENINFWEGIDSKKMDSMVASTAIQLGRAIEALHNAGLIHRDIKLENIVIDKENGYLKLLDFGIAKALDEAGVKRETYSDEDTSKKVTKKVGKSITQPLGGFPGSPDYMAPEVLQGTQKPDFSSDLYSYGASLYRLRTNTPPMPNTENGGNIAYVEKILNPIPSIETRIKKEYGEGCYQPSVFDPIIETLIKLDPKDRKKVEIDGEVYKLETITQVVEAFKKLAEKNNIPTDLPWTDISGKGFKSDQGARSDKEWESVSTDTDIDLSPIAPVADKAKETKTVHPPSYFSDTGIDLVPATDEPEINDTVTDSSPPAQMKKPNIFKRLLNLFRK